jgi:hypothetical protein
MTKQIVRSLTQGVEVRLDVSQQRLCKASKSVAVFWFMHTFHERRKVVIWLKGGSSAILVLVAKSGEPASGKIKGSLSFP